MARFSQKKVIEYKFVIRVYLQHMSEIFAIPRRTEGDMIKIVHWSPRKVPSIPVRF